MKPHRLFMSASMIPAMLSGAKTQHRVLMKQPPSVFAGGCHPKNTPRHAAPYFDSYRSEPRTPENPRGMSEYWCWWTEGDHQGPDWIRCPYGKPGDEVWVPETWRIEETGTRAGKPDYRSDDPSASGAGFIPWRSPTTMPRWAARIFRRVKAVRVERDGDAWFWLLDFEEAK